MRAAIARALANQPAIVLADEPTGNLDARSGREALQTLRSILHDHEDGKEEPKSVIVVTHDIHLALEFADEIVVLSNGKVKSQYRSGEQGDKQMSFEGNKENAIARIQNRLLTDIEVG